MTTLAPIAAAPVREIPDEYSVTLKPDSTHNPYMGCGFGAIGKGWLVTVTHKPSKASFTFQACGAAGDTEPLSVSNVLDALRADIALDSATDAVVAERFKLTSNVAAEVSFLRNTLRKRAREAKRLGITDVGPAVKPLQRPAVATPAPLPPLPPPPPPPAPADKRTRSKNPTVPALPPPPPPPVADVAAALDF